MQHAPMQAHNYLLDNFTKMTGTTWSDGAGLCDQFCNSFTAGETHPYANQWLAAGALVSILAVALWILVITALVTRPLVRALLSADWGVFRTFPACANSPYRSQRPRLTWKSCATALQAGVWGPALQLLCKAGFGAVLMRPHGHQPKLVDATHPETHGVRRQSAGEGGLLLRPPALTPKPGDQPSGCSAPRHIAVIMDGNRRYGKLVHGDALKGHHEGGKRLTEFLGWCQDLGVHMVTAYAFSTENWSRDPAEVSALMDIICRYCRECQQECLKRNTRIRVLATDRPRLPADVRRAIDDAERETRQCDGFHLNICLSYGGRQEIVGACQSVARAVAQGHLRPDEVTQHAFQGHLLTAGLPDPEILLRTSGEFRLSNFLLFQMAYTEMFFLDKFWPQLTREDVQHVITKYTLRQRRFGS